MTDFITIVLQMNVFTGRDFTDLYSTPPEFIRKIERDLNIEFSKFDPCPIDRNADFDGLTVPWGNRDEWVFVNPPYSNTSAFITKGIEEYTKNGVQICFLIPARTCNLTWQNIILPTANKILFLRTGFRFNNPDGIKTKGQAPMPLALVFFGEGFDGQRVDTYNWIQ